MAANAENLLKEALSLPSIQRAKLVDDLLSSLDRPDDSIDQAWKTEVGKRLDSLRSGKLRRIPLEEVLAKYRRP